MDDILKHSRFYMTTVTFLVEDCLFRVPRGPFETESTVFRDMFLLPTGDQDVLEGSSDANPIQLEGIKKDDFEQLLKVLYPYYCSREPEQPAGREQWTSVLKLSALWMLEQVRQIAINALASVDLTAVERLVLAMEYDITDWFIPAVNDIARRPEPIGMEDVNHLGVEVALKIAAVREQLTFKVVQEHSKSRKPFHVYEFTVGPRHAQNLDFTPCIRDIFNL
ncbi:hypothetical protein F5I97DRAFT_1940329 [Phlebopus sp. FC_14]|nr:hypothetical protein F5I97DRAFT_1940329 [Phlebopus sp. FC_14]